MMTATAKNVTKKPQEGRKSSGLGLHTIGDLSGLLDTPAVAANSVNAGPIDLLMELIDEDPNQPRKEDNPGFSAESIAELGATIKIRGVKSPISVRKNLEAEGRYIINHGARRYRASKWAGKDTIPSFIDNDYNEADQVIENLQRNELMPREIADFIGRELAKGKKKSDIAKEIGKSPAFITQHVVLLDLPEPVAEVFNAGRVRDVTVVNELVTAYKKKPNEVAVWLADDEQELTRGSVKLLREFLDDKICDLTETVDLLNNNFGTEEDGEQQGPTNEMADATEAGTPKAQDPDKLKKAIVQVRHNDRLARLMLAKRPPGNGFAWLKYDDDGHEIEADLTEVQLVALIEG